MWSLLCRDQMGKALGEDTVGTSWVGKEVIGG